MLGFIADVGAPNLGVCVDSGHCNFEHVDIIDAIRKIGNLFFETHFHDNFGDTDSHFPVGIGTLNWREVINAMIDSSYNGLITFEQSNNLVNSLNWNLFLNAGGEGLEKQGGACPNRNLTPCHQA